MKQQAKNKPGFTDETSVIMAVYLNTLIKRTDDKATTGAAMKVNIEAVDFEGFGTEHASFLLKQNK